MFRLTGVSNVYLPVANAEPRRVVASCVPPVEPLTRVAPASSAVSVRE